MDYGLKGKTALVLGAGGGLGGAISRTLAEEGANVAMADVNLDSVEQLAESLHGDGHKVLPVQWDLNDLDAIEDKVTQIENTLGKIDILVNNTGGPPPTPAQGQPTALWTENFQMMVVSLIKLTDRVLPHMKAQNWGRIINSTSSGVVVPIPNLAISNSLRMAVVGWSKTLSREVAKDGITVNVVLPGRIATDRIRFLDEAKAKRESRDVESVINESTSTIPMGRYGTPEEYAKTVAFIASNSASYITGSIFRVDGGLIGSV